VAALELQKKFKVTVAVQGVDYKNISSAVPKHIRLTTRVDSATHRDEHCLSFVYTNTSHMCLTKWKSRAIIAGLFPVNSTSSSFCSQLGTVYVNPFQSSSNYSSHFLLQKNV